MASALLSKYLRSRYESGGRGPHAFDCYGLVRLVRSELFGKTLLGEHMGVLDTDKAELTRICREESKDMRESEPVPGVLATCWRGPLFFHVGIVVEIDGRLAVLETNKKTGPRWKTIADFERIYTRVIYYD